MRRDNLFVAGPQASGEAFLGRHPEQALLGDMLFGSYPCHGLSLVGPRRIGKSSLAAKVLQDHPDPANVAVVKMCMAEYTSAFDFWTSFAAALAEALRRRDLLDETPARAAAALEALQQADANWYRRLMQPLKTLLESAASHGLRTLWVVDEFDAAAWVLDGKHHYQLLRTIASDTGVYNTTTVLISRSPIAQIERRNDGISTLHGVFREVVLHGFSDEDMTEYYGALGEYDIFLPPEGCARLEHFAGRTPYLLSMFGQELADLAISQKPADTAAIDAVFAQMLPQINQYYEDLVRNFTADNQMEALLDAVFGPHIRARQRAIDALYHMDYLRVDAAGQYYALSEDFTVYLRLAQSELPLYDTMFRAEKRLREFVALRYPQWASLHYDARLEKSDQLRLWANANCQLDGRSLDELYGYCRSLNHWMPTSSLLDVMTLSRIVDVIEKNWASFAPCFGGGDDWPARLEQLRQVRNPLAHAHQECVPDEVLQKVVEDCNAICALPAPAAR